MFKLNWVNEDVRRNVAWPDFCIDSSMAVVRASFIHIRLDTGYENGHLETKVIRKIVCECRHLRYLLDCCRSPPPNMNLRLNSERRLSMVNGLLSNNVLNNHACVIWSRYNLFIYLSIIHLFIYFLSLSANCAGLPGVDTFYH